MKIAVDTVFFNRAYSGISRVWENILTGIAKIESRSYEIILLIRGNTIPTSIKPLTSSYKTVFIPEFHYHTILQDVDILNHICATHGIDLLISTYFTYCTEVPNILVIHDMIPEIFKMPMNPMWQQKIQAIKYAAGFITISETTHQDLIRYNPFIKIDKTPVYKVYNGIEQSPSKTGKYNGEFIEKVLKQNGIPPQNGYIFTIATNNEDYKNVKLIQNLIGLYRVQLSNLLKSPIPVIVLIREPLPAPGYKVENGVMYLSHVPDDCLNTLYKYAMCYINPSRYEGFGLPVFEAFIQHIPVIALDLPIYEELCPGAIHYISDPSDIASLYEKIVYLADTITHMRAIQKKIDKGMEHVKKYTIEKQVSGYHEILTNLSGNSIPNSITNPNPVINPVINIICQSYKDCNPDRMSELLYCITRNLENPHIRWVHDFGYMPETYLPETIFKHPKYISVYGKYHSTPHTLSHSITHTKEYIQIQKRFQENNINLDVFFKDITQKVYWLRYSDSFIYSQYKTVINPGKYGSVWGIINCDIFLDDASPWNLISGWLNDGFILAQSRHEFNQNPAFVKMDDNFAKLFHATTQDGWFYKIQNQDSRLFPVELISNSRFEIGMLGCDNAISDRLIRYGGFKVINKPVKFKLMHYDSARGKNSDNFLDIHSGEKTKIVKPKNSHPERDGCYLVPNCDQMTGLTLGMDLIGLIRGIGGISNLEIYKLISEMISKRVMINNPD
jgi:hypothetical protein